MKKKFIAVVSIFALAVGVLTGCGINAGGQGEKVSVIGSTTVAAPMEELVKAYNAQNPDQVIEVQGVGSSAGIKAAHDQTADIGMASRELKDEEKEWGLNEVTIARDAIAVVLHPQNPVQELTTEQIQKIFSGEIQNWSELGGNDEQIIVVSREAGSGTRSAFEEILEVEVASTALISEGNGAVKANVASKVGGIGYVSLGYIDETVKPVTVDGVVPNVETVTSDLYKVARPLLILTNGEESEQAKSFIQFILSEEGQEILAKKYIPVK